MAVGKSSTKEESDLFAKMFDAWNGNGVALLLELARSYTQSYPDKYWGWIALADVLGDLARYSEAQCALRSAQKVAPAGRQGKVYAHWGHLYEKKCDLKQAERWFRRALKQSTGKNKMRCLIYLGGVLARQGRLNEAEACHRKAVSMSHDPQDEGYYNLGLVLRAQERYKDALKYFTRAVKIDPAYTIAEIAWKDVLSAEKFKKQNRREKSKSERH